VDEYLDVYLKTPDLPKDDTVRALVARGMAHKSARQRLSLMESSAFVVLLSNGVSC